jgi:hypothetical protein
MKFILFVSFFYSINLSVQAQDYKRNHNWVLGFMPVVTLDFNSSTILMDSFNNIALMSSSCISNTNGDLELFSSGFVLLNKDGNIIDNGLDVNSPYGVMLANNASHYSPYEQTSIILPKKGNQYYVFSTGMSDSAAINCQQQLKCIFDVLNYSVVDMDSNAGNGKVVEKNVLLYDNQEYRYVDLHAIRHGNGVDWWLIKSDCYHNQFQLFHVSADTILGPYKYQIADTADWCYLFSQIHFSSDGTKLVSNMYSETSGLTNYDNFNRVDLFNFNRCTGEITYRNKYIVPLDTVNYPNWSDKRGMSFSPDSKLLYLSNLYEIYQIDLEDTTVIQNQLIHGPDTAIADFPGYSSMACGPDGRLYIGNFNGTRQYMSYIENPNVKGLGCNFVSQGLWQPYTNLLTPPNMPNYGLGVDTANGCWPLSASPYPSEGGELLEVYPNPSSTSITISCEALKGKRVKVNFYNMLGQELMSNECHFAQQNYTLNIQQLPRGVYLLKVGEWVRRVVVE